MDLIYEGKAKKLFTTENPNELRMVFKDDATAFNGEKKSTFANKGRLNKKLSYLLYQLLEKEGVATHFAADDGPESLLWSILSPRRCGGSRMPRRARERKRNGARSWMP